MSDFGRPRGLGRGLSALLGEPMRADFGRPEPTAAPGAPASGGGVVEPFPGVTPPASIEALFTDTSPAPAAAPAAAPQTEAVAAPPGEAAPLALAIGLIDRNPSQPRKHFDEAELEELAASIRTHGVLQPILVRPMPGGRFEIVAGERRWRAAQKAGVSAIPALVRSFSDREALEIAIIENVQRTDLNPIEEALGYQALIDRFGRTQQDIADQVGKSRPHIANILRLLSLPEDVQAMVRDGRLSAGHAKAIIGAPDPISLARLAIAGGLSVREIEKLAQRAKEGGEVKPDKPEKDADLKAIEEKLAGMLSLAVAIAPKGEGGGELRIAYKTAEQLDDLCRRLSGGGHS